VFPEFPGQFCVKEQREQAISECRPPRRKDLRKQMGALCGKLDDLLSMCRTGRNPRRGAASRGLHDLVLLARISQHLLIGCCGSPVR
jgi:hypothetical protein